MDESAKDGLRDGEVVMNYLDELLRDWRVDIDHLESFFLVTMTSRRDGSAHTVRRRTLRTALTAAWAGER